MRIIRIINKKVFLNFLFVFFIFCLLFFILARGIIAQVDDLKEQIKKQQEYIQELEKQQKIYQENIKIKQKESLTLKNQLSILNSQIAKKNIEIKQKEAEIKKTNLEIAEIQRQTKIKKIEIIDLKEKIKELLNKIYQNDRKSYLEVVVLNQSISGFFQLATASETIHSALQKTLDKVQLIKEELENQEDLLQEKREIIKTLKTELNQKKNELGIEKGMKNNLLEETQGAEWKFQTLLAEAKMEMRKVEQEIVRLEKEVREKIAREKEKEWMELEELGILVFSWPVPKLSITAIFHDPDYPFRKWLGEHSGIDIRASQGTSIRASAGGYVARAKHGGLGYSYIMIVHQQGFSTVYGHVSEIYVEEGSFVKRGDIIGRSGGLPGTPGAGRFSTGPHLHFEIRKNGLPINPMNYLP